MDFYRIATRELKQGGFEIYPDFRVGRSKDLMIQGRSFYAIWDEKAGLWSTDEYDVVRLVDAELYAHRDKMMEEAPGVYVVRDMRSFGSKSWTQFRQFINNISDNSHQLDNDLTFLDTPVSKSDYASKRLPYALKSGDYSAWDELVGTLYSVEERAKLEWAIGALVSGDAKKIQKFLVLYGPAGTGKSTVLDILMKLFNGYTTTFDAKALGGNSNAFATEVFKGNPLVAIQHDGDLSKIEDNTKLNSIISHEEMTMNEKYKPGYTAKVNAFLWMGTNQPVKISDAKSGIIRRLIDVHPTGVKLAPNHYFTLLSRIDFELGAIAQHCLDVYREMGKNYYNGYRPLEMMLQTDVFYNFIEYNFDVFREQDGATLKQAYALYKEFCSETGIEKVSPQYKVREELRNYFEEFHDRAEVGGVSVRSYYSGFKATPFKAPTKEANTFSLVLDETVSLLDEVLADMPAQEASPDGLPKKRWANVRTSLSDIDTSILHYVKIPENHIVIDFDLKDENGNKSLEKNLEAASVWPATYAELSKGGAGVHLHYLYDGPVDELGALYSDGIEVKTLLGDSSLRRRLSKCNNVQVATISSGLPKKERKVYSEAQIKSEKGLRELIVRTLNKEFHAGTKPSVDFIKKILDDAYADGLVYDVTDMRDTILAYANNSTNQSLTAIKVVQEMKFSSQRDDPPFDDCAHCEKPIIFYDVEVYPNLFLIRWIDETSEDDPVIMLNPTPEDVEAWLNAYRLIGFYNRRYDNHIVYGRVLGMDNEALYKLSQKIVTGEGNAGMFGEAYNLSYSDIYDYTSVKMTLKKWEVELGLKHMEMDIPWNEPVKDEDVPRVIEYCGNDVLATREVHRARNGDWQARLILSELSGLSPNHTTQQHTAKIVFEGNRNARASFVYTDLSVDFPGYVFDLGKSHYRGEVTGEGGYVYAEPGMYENVALLDVASMHPTSIEQLNLFGEYTKNFTAIKEARLAIKHGDLESASKMLDGKLAPFLGDPETAEALSYALKIAINIVYGLTSAKFDNPFKDPRNKDNIVAKRGSLFMVDLKHEVQQRGFTVAHIKTDSIKIPNATPEIIDFVFEYGRKYGYDFEHEATYEKMCLVNDAVYIAKVGWAMKEKKIGTWEAVGAQFQHPYVYKTLFTHQDLTFNDFVETKSVAKGAMYIDFEYDTPMVTAHEGLHFVGKTGTFIPVEEHANGGILYRVDGDRMHAVTGTKNYLWIEAEVARNLDSPVRVNELYFESLAEKAVRTINKYGDFERFAS